MTKDEALRLALEALQSGVKTKANRLEWIEYDCELVEQAVTAIKAALVNEALERKAENARELGLDYYVPCCADQTCPKCKAALEAKDEPVAYMRTDIEGNPNKFRLNSFGGCIPLYVKKTGGAS